MRSLYGLMLVPAGGALAAPPGSDYRLVFADEFNGTTLDSTKWVDAYPWGRTHNHDAYVASSNVIVGGGELTLRAQRVAQGGKPFTSGAISTGYTKYRFDGGYVEARVKLPTTPGSWPAFWGLDNGWPPEADIMEFPLTTDGGANGYPNTDYHTAFHYVNGSGGNTAGAGRVNPSGVGDLSLAYHTFGMDWVSDTSVRFYFDGVQVSSFANSAVAQMTEMYLIMNYAVGGWPGTPSLAQWPNGHIDETKVDWIRVWQKNAGDPPSSWNIDGGGTFVTAGNWTAGVPKYGNQVATFGRVGSASAATITLGNWHVLGGITFDGSAGGTTAYTIGTSASVIQLAGTAGATVQALSTGTATQNVGARLELWSDTTFRNDMSGGQLLNINSEVSGNGRMIVEGVGAVVLSGVNTYTGGTIIDAGSQGPAVLRVNASSALGGGSVIIGEQGNATQARLELIGGRTIANNIDFRGRNNNSVGILNLNGSNTISGTVTAEVGGTTPYQIQSDLGTLFMTGLAAGASVPGVALRAASGSRTFSFQGAGNAAITGKIENGGGTVSLVKAGSGILLLTAANSYTGGTTINDGGGTVRISNAAALGTGSVTIGNGGANQTGVLQLASGVNVTAVPTINFASRSLSNAGGSAHLENFSGNSTLSANLNINNVGGNAVNILSSVGKLTLTGNLSSTGLTSPRGYNFYGAAEGLVSGIISNGTAQPTFVQKEGSGTWTLGGNNTYTGGTTVNAGVLIASHARAFAGGALSVNGGIAKVQTGSLAVAVSAMTLGAGAKVDLGNSAMVITDLASTPHATTVSRVITGYNAGAWDGAGGIVSSLADAGNIGVGYAQTSELPAYATGFRGGQAYAGNVSLLATTYYGDANLDGTVDSTDFNTTFGNPANFGVSVGGTWTGGDFNHDGRVDTQDFNLLAGNFSKTFAAALPGGLALLGATVPEPSASLLLAVGAVTILARRRRDRTCRHHQPADH